VVRMLVGVSLARAVRMLTGGDVGEGGSDADGGADVGGDFNASDAGGGCVCEGGSDVDGGKGSAG